MILSREDCSDLPLDASIIAQSRRWLTSAVILPSGLGGDLCGLVVWVIEALPMGRTLVSDSPPGRDVDLQIGMLTGNNTYTAA